MSSAAERNRRGAAARRVVEHNRGALDKLLAEIAGFLPPRQFVALL